MRTVKVCTNSFHFNHFPLGRFFSRSPAPGVRAIVKKAKNSKPHRLKSMLLKRVRRASAHGFEITWRIMRRRFFVDRFEGDSAVLRGDSAHHLGRVLRAESGQLYELSDGNSVWLARTENVGREAVEFALLERLPVRRSPLKLTLLLAIVKFDRFEWAIEKATELGVNEIVPLAAGRSEKGLIAASVKRAERWEKILVESSQQSRRLSVPVLHETQSPRAAFPAANSQLGLLLSELADARPMRERVEPVAAEARANKVVSVTIAIGPEGGWADEEFSAARASNFAEVALGVNIMRTETAVCAALAGVQYAFGALAQAGDPHSVRPEGIGEIE